MTIEETLKNNTEYKNYVRSVRRLVSDLLEDITPKKGVHYFDGKDGEDGKHGKDGRDAKGERGERGLKGETGKAADPVDKNALVREIMAMIEIPQVRDGVDGERGKDADGAMIAQAVKAEILEFLKAKKLGITDVDGLEIALANARASKKGGQGKTYRLLSSWTTPVGTDVTTADNTTFSFKKPPLHSEFEIYRGGARIFEENGDYTVSLFPGDRVKSITTATMVNISGGEYINFRTKG